MKRPNYTETWDRVYDSRWAADDYAGLEIFALKKYSELLKEYCDFLIQELDGHGYVFEEEDNE